MRGQGRARKSFTTQEALGRYVFQSYRRNCKTRGRKFDLLWEEFFPLILRPCHYCARPPSNRARRPRAHGQAVLLYSGLDRVDNARGYCPRNVVPCCHECNQVKGERLSYTEMLLVARLLNRVRAGVRVTPAALQQAAPESQVLLRSILRLNSRRRS